MPKNDNWSTPPDLIERLEKDFPFTHEIFAAEGNRALPSLPYYGLDNGKDAFEVEWEDNSVNFLNPPYSFLTKAVHLTCGWTTIKPSITSVMLIPAYTDTKYFQDCIAKDAIQVRLLKGRLRFWEGGKPGKDTARFASAIVVFGQNYLLKGPEMVFWDWKS